MELTQSPIAGKVLDTSGFIHLLQPGSLEIRGSQDAMLDIETPRKAFFLDDNSIFVTFIAGTRYANLNFRCPCHANTASRIFGASGDEWTVVEEREMSPGFFMCVCQFLRPLLADTRSKGWNVSIAVQEVLLDGGSHRRH